VEGREAPSVERRMLTPQSTVPVVCASRTYRTLTTVPIVYIGDTVQVATGTTVVLYGYTLGFPLV
jgi:hypothetical protein